MGGKVKEMRRTGMARTIQYGVLQSLLLHHKHFTFYD